MNSRDIFEKLRSLKGDEPHILEIIQKCDELSKIGFELQKVCDQIEMEKEEIDGRIIVRKALYLRAKQLSHELNEKESQLNELLPE